jgi:hypothetical protein
VEGGISEKLPETGPFPEAEFWPCFSVGHEGYVLVRQSSTRFNPVPPESETVYEMAKLFPKVTEDGATLKALIVGGVVSGGAVVRISLDPLCEASATQPSGLPSFQ